VNGVAQLHSDILKSELFANYVSIWPTKFQNKTNGITPRRWIQFCNPELSGIITKWLKTDKWVTNLDLLTGLRQVTTQMLLLCCKLIPITNPCYLSIVCRQWRSAARMAVCKDG